MRKLVVVIALLLCPEAAAAAVVAEQPRSAEVVGGRGVFAWSRYDEATSSYRLMLTRGTSARQLPVRGRPVPFDVQVADDRRGPVRLVYSRCDGYAPPCTLREFSLEADRETALAVSAPRGVRSMTMPSVSRGRIAYAGRTRRGRTQIYVGRLDGRSRLVPIARPGGDDPFLGDRDVPSEPTSLALRGRRIAYTWRYVGQRPGCADDTRVGPVPNSMLVVTDGAARGEVVQHANCDEDAASAVHEVTWAGRASLRYLATPTGQPGVTALWRQRVGSDRVSSWVPDPVPGEIRDLRGYATDGVGSALGQVHEQILTLPVLP